ncbi:MAG: response regulator transcription factor [Chloroflexi bacterium]|nr:response regulator transcription factor [Chloroflexota bacterium]
MIRVAVVDDQTLFREGLASLLALVPGISVVGKAAGGREALALVAEQAPDVVLMDVQMPGMNGVVCTREIRSRFPATQVIMLTTYEDEEYLFEALRSGAAGYLLKTADPDHLAEAIRAVCGGQSILDPGVTHKVVNRLRSLADGIPTEPALTERLTQRDREVLRLMADGLANAAIAQRLCLADGTVKNLVSRIIAKLGARDRTHAVRLAVEWGLLGECHGA